MCSFNFRAGKPLTLVAVMVMPVMANAERPDAHVLTAADANAASVAASCLPSIRGQLRLFCEAGVRRRSEWRRLVDEVRFCARQRRKGKRAHRAALVENLN